MIDQPNHGTVRPNLILATCLQMTQLRHQDLCNPNYWLVELRTHFLSRETHMARLLLSIAGLLVGLSDAAFGQTSTEVVLARVNGTSPSGRAFFPRLRLSRM